jgi:hypothetical protein
MKPSEIIELTDFLRSRPWAPSSEAEIRRLVIEVQRRCESASAAIALLTAISERNPSKRITAEEVRNAPLVVTKRERRCPECENHNGWRFARYHLRYQDGRLHSIRRLAEGEDAEEVAKPGQEYVTWAVEPCTCRQSGT